MPGTTIGKSLNYGYPGTVSRNGPHIITNRPLRTTNVTSANFGDPVVLNQDNTFSKFGQVATTLSTALTASTAYTTITVASLPDNVEVGMQVTLTSGANTQTTTVTAFAATSTGAATVTVSSFTANFAYPTTTTVTFTSTASYFAGVAVRAVKQSTNYLSSSTGTYTAGQPMDVLEYGSIIVTCNVGTPVAGGNVYIRVATNGSIPAGVIGGFEAAADGTNTVLLTNAKWKTGKKDANNSCEVTLLTQLNP